jgi:hypothetical protein
VVYDVEWDHLLPQVFLLPTIDALISAVKGSMKQSLTDFSKFSRVEGAREDCSGQKKKKKKL